MQENMIGLRISKVTTNNNDRQMCINKLELNIFVNSLIEAPFPIATERKRCVETSNAPFKNESIAIIPAIKLYNPKSSTPNNFNAILVDKRVTTPAITILTYNAAVFMIILFPCPIVKFTYLMVEDNLDYNNSNSRYTMLK